MRRILLGLVALGSLSACGAIGGPEARPTGPLPASGTDGGGPGSSPNSCGSTNDSDVDGDGYTPAQGDCNDCDPNVNPGAVQIPGDPTDYACNGMAGVVPTCDTSLAGMSDANSLASAADICDPRFVKSVTLVGPSDQQARKVKAKYGVLAPRLGAAMTLISNGIAADTSDPNFVPVDPGTQLSGSNQYANPLPGLPGIAGCGQSEPSMVYDYTELVVQLKAPSNAKAFSFDFQFFSAEYPQFVCTSFNDEFLVLQQSAGEFPQPTNIAFDSAKNPITVNNGLFTVCQNDTTDCGAGSGGLPNATACNHCTAPVTQFSGTGFDAAQFGSAPGGSTGWLTTTSPVTPGEDVTLHFIVFDEGDHILDSAALIDNFHWITTTVAAPMTMPIQ